MSTLADTDNALLRKIVAACGGIPFPGDTGNQLLRKLLICLNSSGVDETTLYFPGDTDNNIYRKILTRTANDLVFLGITDSAQLRAQPADLDTALLRKILVWMNGTANALAEGTYPLPGDTLNALLRKLLTRINLGGPLI
jgi:hypothetical protein